MFSFFKKNKKDQEFEQNDEKKKWPTIRQLRHTFKVLPSRERWLARILLIIILVSIGVLIFNYYWGKTEGIPQVGGIYREGILGQPRFINPILAQTNDTDRDITQLIFSGLFKYDGHSQLVPDLAKEYSVSEDGLTYTVKLKKGLLWHNGETLTADDIVFTIKTIQDRAYGSPLRINWQTIEVEKIDQHTIEFKLKNIYAPFIHNLTVGILPKHLWAGISDQNFPLAEHNLKPVGSGPYKFEELEQDKSERISSISLIRNESFYLTEDKNNKNLQLDGKNALENKPPYIEKITIKFYGSQDGLLNAYQNYQVDGIGLLSASGYSQLHSRTEIRQISIPVYYAVFFNQSQSKALSDKTVRIALSYATNKEELIDRVLDGKGQIVDSPFLPNWPFYTDQINVYDFALEHANNILEEEGWQDTDGDGIRQKEINKEEVNLEINLTSTNWPEVVQTAEILKEQWEKIGARINLEIVNSANIQQDYIKPRQYQTLLFGEVLGADPDPFAFWHSSHKKDPFLNLALYQNQDADKLLEEARQTINQSAREEKYKEFQKIITQDAPAVFLYSPNYLYAVNKKVKGLDIKKMALPSQRFSQVENWYIKTKRIDKTD